MFPPPQVSFMTTSIDSERYTIIRVPDSDNAAVVWNGGAISDDTQVAEDVESIDALAADLIDSVVRVEGGVEGRFGGSALALRKHSFNNP